jgi:hypothetical protein
LALFLLGEGSVCWQVVGEVEFLLLVLRVEEGESFQLEVEAEFFQLAEAVQFFQQVEVAF